MARVVSLLIVIMILMICVAAVMIILKTVKELYMKLVDIVSLNFLHYRSSRVFYVISFELELYQPVSMFFDVELAN
jgi:hypothetical protein